MERFVLNPEYILVDFELAAIAALEHHFPNVEIKGCYFHFAQCLWRNFEHKTDYLDTNQIGLHKWFKSFLALPLLPPQFVENVVEKLYDELNDEEIEWVKAFPDLEKFTDYFVKVWIEGNFPITLWNHYSNTGPRTNNNVESYNRRINNLLIASKPNIWKYISLIKQEESNSHIKVVHLQNNTMKKRGRSSKYLLLDLTISNLKFKYSSKEINFEKYLESIVQVVHEFRNDYKKKLSND